MELRDTERRGATEALTLVIFLRRIVIGLSGGLVLIVGVAMTILPGPAIVVVPLGLAILATEFVWARRLMRRFRDVSDRVAASVRRPQAKASGKPAWSKDPSHATADRESHAHYGRRETQRCDAKGRRRDGLTQDQKFF